MMKKIMAALLIFCMMCPIVTIAGSAAAAEINPIVLDFSNQATFNSTVKSIVDNGDLLHLSFTKVEEIECTKLEYGTYTGPYQGPKISFSNYYTVFDFSNVKDQLTAKPNSSYAVIVYMTQDKAHNEVKLFAGNRNRSSVTLVKDASVSNGKMVRSEAINIADSFVFTERIAKGLSVRLQYESFKENTELYVKEIAFFESAEDANTYYGNKYDIAGTGTVERPTEVKFDFSSFDAMRKSKLNPFIDVNDTFKGEFVSDGEGSLKLNYGEYTGANQVAKLTLSNYYAYFSNQAEGFFRTPEEMKYMVIVFMTKDKNKAPVFLWNSASMEAVQIVDNASASNGKFVRSPAMDVSDCQIFSRIANETKVMPFAISYDSYEKNTELYIKEMVFFKSVEDADKYYSNRYEVVENDSELPPPPPVPETEATLPEQTTTVPAVTTVPESTADAPSTTEAAKEEKKGGCGSVIAPLSVVFISFCAVGAAAFKKRR